MKVRKYIYPHFLVLSVILFFLFTPFLKAQKNLDSLVFHLEEMEDNKAKVRNMLYIFEQLADYGEDVQEIYLFDAVKLANNLKDTFLLIETYEKWANFEFKRSNYHEALMTYHDLTSLKENFPLFTDTLSYSQTLNRMGSCHYGMGNFESALEYYNRALLLRMEVGDKSMIALTYNDMGNSYVFMGDYDKAEEFLNKSRKLMIANNDSSILYHTSINMGNLMYKKGEMKKAINFYNEGLALGQKFNLPNVITSCLNNIASVYYYQDDYKKSLQIHLLNLEEREKIGEQHAISVSHFNIANCYTMLGNFQKAKEHYHKAKEIQLTIDAKNSLVNTFQALAEMHIEAKEYNLAVDYYDDLILLKDSLLNVEKVRIIEENEAIFNNLRLRKEIELYEKENQILQLKKENAEKQAEIERTQKRMLFIFLPVLLLIFLWIGNRFLGKK